MAQLVDGRRDATAVAWDSVRGELVLGREDGAWLASPPGGEPPIPVLHRGAVIDLRVDGAGQLWVATERGLFLRRADGAWQEQQLGAGASREVRRLVAGPGGSIACATAAGAFLRHPDGVWRRLDGILPREDVTALAFRADGGAVWLVSAGDLHAARLEGFVAHEGRRLSLPEGREAVVDLLPGEATLWVLTERRLLQLDGADHFEVERLPLAPGAGALRLARAHGRLWVATDRGLIGQGADRWNPAPGGLANAGIAALAGGPDRLLTAGERGVHRLVTALPVPTSQRTRLPAGPSPWEGEPGIAAVRLAALRYLELDRGPIRSMAARARARGWLPEVELRGGYGGLRRRSADWDQTFSSGEDRLFFDRDQQRTRDFDVQAVLRWELGDTVYHAEELDIAKERREVIELRDEVLDELQQIFFERRRVLLSLVTQSDPREPETARLRLRAAELAAGLDAWTGGWWSRASLASPRIESEILP